LAAWTWSLTASATIPVDGDLVATRDCLATPAQATTATPGAATESVRSRPGAFVLALSWQPAFCEVNRRKPECRAQTPERPDASRFSLHGLWPQPRENAYCGVDSRTRRLDREGTWTALPGLDLRPDTRERLAALMPGTRSGLHRHEWISHGTCYGTDADTYFTHALALAEQVNASRIRALLVEHRGSHLSSNEVRAAFDAEFGRGAGERVRLVCEAGMIGELRLSLKGEISERSRIGPLMQAAVPLSPRCRGGRVDEAGFE
jgi:ribonuclease T2